MSREKEKAEPVVEIKKSQPFQAQGASAAHGPTPNPCPCSAGNQAVQRAYRSGVAQAMLDGSLPISSPDDSHEREAEYIASQIDQGRQAPAPGRLPSPVLHRKAGDGTQTAAAGPARAAAFRGTGQALDSGTQSFFQQRLGHDLSSVRVHDNSSADVAARSINARAFTIGQDIAFRSGQYSPNSRAGRSLLAHELVHTIQQGGRSTPAMVQRQPAASAPALAPETESPGTSLRMAAEQIVTTGLTRFQESVDNVNEAGVKLAGNDLWRLADQVDVAYHQLTAPVGSTSAPGGPRAVPLPAYLQPVYDDARRRILSGVSTQKFRGTYVLGSEQVPRYTGDLAPFVQEQTEAVAWVVKDAARLMAILQQETVPEPQQWEVIGLLRQHMNPWHFAYLQAAGNVHDLSRRAGAFAEGPRQAHMRLLETQGQIRMAGTMQASDAMGTFALMPGENKVRLLQPFSPIEVAEMLYGSRDQWNTHLVPFNRNTLSGVGPNQWLLMGTELIVDPELLVPRLRATFISMARARQLQQQRGSSPYIISSAQSESAAVVGTTIRYTVLWPNSAFESVRLQWWVETDPIAVRENGLPARVNGPNGTLRWVGESENTFEARASAPGNHVIKCRFSFSDNRSEEVRFVQTVMTLEERTNLAFQRETDWNRSPGEVLQQLRQERDRLGNSSAAAARRQALDRRIEQLETALRSADAEARQYRGRSAHLMPVHAVYVSQEETPMSVPLLVYVDEDPGYFDDTSNVHLILWDFTLEGTRTYTAVKPRRIEALRSLFRTFADDAPYPKGNMRFQITSSMLAFERDAPETVTYPTDGGVMFASVLRHLSMGATAIGVGALVLGQAEVALPAFIISGLLAGAAGGFNLWDRLEHGDFEWDLQAGMDILDIASAVMTAGAASGVTGTVRNVGRMTLVSKINLGIEGAQLGIMGATHVSHLNEAVRSNNRDQVVQVLLQIVADGALIIVIHRLSSAAHGRGRPGDSETPEPHGTRRSGLPDLGRSGPRPEHPDLQFCVLGSLFCPRGIPLRVRNRVGPYPLPERVPYPGGEFILRGTTDAEYMAARTSFRAGTARRLYVEHPEIWTPEFQRAYNARRRRWPDADPEVWWPRDGDRKLTGARWEVHHGRPIDFGGENLLQNYVPLEKSVHQQYTNWWNSLKREIGRYFSEAEWNQIIGGDRNRIFMPSDFD